MPMILIYFHYLLSERIVVSAVVGDMQDNLLENRDGMTSLLHMSQVIVLDVVMIILVHYAHV